MDRIGLDSYFMTMAHVAATRSTCLRRHVGAVLVKDKHVISTGYNGAPSGIIHCEYAGCLREQLNVPSGQRCEICRGLHAEQNAIIQAALHGVSTKNSVLYCTHCPCSICAKVLINAGIKRVVYAEGYPDALGMKLCIEADIDVEKLE